MFATVGIPRAPARPPLRLLSLNPAVRGHNTNLAAAGTGVDELAGQADQALATKPLPELFLIQSVDNYGQVAGRLPGPRAANSGTGPCDLFDIAPSDGAHLTIARRRGPGPQPEATTRQASLPSGSATTHQTQPSSSWRWRIWPPRSVTWALEASASLTT